MTDNSYSDWSNYSTWLVNLWLSKESPGIPLNTTADQLRETVDEIIEASMAPEGLVYDLVQAALGEVDFDEIAEANKED